jgi:alkaline phosphatase
MNRRHFLLNAGLLGSAGFLGKKAFSAAPTPLSVDETDRSTAKNVIFLVSDGMSIGTLTLCDTLMQRKMGKGGHWMSLYKSRKGVRALMDTASSNALVTDSAAAGSAWGCGVRVPNGSLNVSAEGELFTPLFKKCIAKGKSVGCVTTVPVTHATPASFCVNAKSRNSQEDIAIDYLSLNFDVMMGGGLEFFDPNKRSDKKDVIADFKAKGYHVALNKSEMQRFANQKKPLLGLFYENGLPYSIDHQQDSELINTVPTLSEMTQTAIDLMKSNNNGFVLQVEAGKVDWAAHGNDTTALLYDQMEFEKALGVALQFADQQKDTLVIVTSDHGNSNPGLFYGKNADKGFEKLFEAKHSHEWILKNIHANHSPSHIVETIEHACNVAIPKDKAVELLSHIMKAEPSESFNPYQMPFHELALILKEHTHVGWASNTHTSDYVELCAYGPGQQLLKPFMLNTELHSLMLQALAIR